MKKLIFLFLIIVSPRLVLSQTAEARKELQVEMEAATTIAYQKFCIDKSGSDSIGRKTWAVRADLTLATKYQNTGQHPIILDKYCGTVSSQRISTTVENAKVKKNVYYSVSNVMVASTKPRKEVGEMPGDSFVILEPGQTYERKTETRLLIGQVEQYNLLSAGTQYLTLGVWTENGLLSEANDIGELRTRWKKYGYLWAEGIMTEPMPISFPKLEELKPCQ